MKSTEFIVEQEEILDEYITDAHRKTIEQTLRRAGYRKLGSGLDATVWAKDAGTVIKVLMPQALFGTSRPTVSVAKSVFLAFYEFCMEHKGDPFLPKFTDVRGSHHSSFELDGEEFVQIAMERLRPLGPKSINRQLVWAFEDLARRTTDFELALKAMMTPKFWAHSLIYTGPELATRINSNPSLKSYYRQFYETIQSLYAEGKRRGFEWDLHTNNVMQRKDGTPVIIDPWTSG